MRGRRTLGYLLLATLAVVFQATLPALSDKMTVAQPFLALLVVLSLRTGRLGGALLGAALGAAADAMQVLRVGFHGISFTLVGYAASWVGGRVLLRGVNPVALLAIAAYFLDVAVVAALHALLGLSLARALWWWVAPGSLFTAFMAVAFELVARRTLPTEAEPWA